MALGGGFADILGVAGGRSPIPPNRQLLTNRNNPSGEDQLCGSESVTKRVLDSRSILTDELCHLAAIAPRTIHCQSTTWLAFGATAFLFSGHSSIQYAIGIYSQVACASPRVFMLGLRRACSRT
jgi:hypothetical protein